MKCLIWNTLVFYQDLRDLVNHYLSTIKEIFEGNKKLFEGLYIFEKWDWTKKYNVIHLDFENMNYETPEELKLSLENFLLNIANKYDITLKGNLLNSNFSELIKKIHRKTG